MKFTESLLGYKLTFQDLDNNYEWNREHILPSSNGHVSLSYLRSSCAYTREVDAPFSSPLFPSKTPTGEMLPFSSQVPKAQYPSSSTCPAFGAQDMYFNETFFIPVGTNEYAIGIQ